MKSFALVAAAMLVLGCANTPTPPNERSAVVDSLYFGTHTPRGYVTERDWRTFLDGVVTPRFPLGLTTWRAAGQWRDHSGQLEKEESYILQIVHPNSTHDDQSITEIIAIYKQRFRQESVLRTRSAARISY